MGWIGAKMLKHIRDVLTEDVRLTPVLYFL